MSRVCLAKHHDTPWAYDRHRCRCPEAIRIRVRRVKRWRLARANGVDCALDATGTQRRIRALGALGWPREEIARRMGCTSQSVAFILTRERVFARTARRIAEIYDELSMTPGPSGLTRIRSTRKGWAPPLAWDDSPGPHYIDDPAATPHRGRERRKSDVDEYAVSLLIEGAHPGGETRAERQAAVLVLVERGLTYQQIADRMHTTKRTIERDLAELRAEADEVA